jgi:hypothetical protein
MKLFTTATIARCLRAAAVALFALTAQEGLAATTVKFQPGAADACGVNVNRMTGGMALANLDQYEDAGTFEWAILNNSPAATTGLPDDRHILFEVNTTATNKLLAGANFNLAFTMRLLSVLGVGGSKQYGVDNAAANIYTDNSRTTLTGATVRYPTHVFVQANVQGSLRTTRNIVSFPAFDLVKSNPEFLQAQFRMYFDADGDPATTGDQVLIAKFGTTSAPDPLSSLAGTVFADVEVVSFIVNWDAALPGVFADQNGHELAIGPPDATDIFLRRVSTATQPTSQVEVDFRFECALSGPCYVATGNTLRLRLHTLTTGQSTISGVPPSTQTPAALCPPDLRLPKSDDVCFPFAFCLFPYFGIVVLVLIAVVVVVVIVVVAKKVSQRAR